MTQLSGAALESLREGLIAVDSRGTIHLYNPAAADLLGVSVGDAVGVSFTAAFLELPHADALTDVILQAIQTGQLHKDYEIEIETRAGRRLMEVTSSFLKDRDGQSATGGIVITLRDVTELRRLSGALEQTNKQLQDAYRDTEEKNQKLTEALKRVQVMRIGATVIVLALVGGLGWYSIRSGESSRAEALAAGAEPGSGADTPLGSKTITVSTGTINRSIRLSGSLDPRSRTTVVSPVGGRVVQRLFRVGDVVKQGQVLMELRDETLASRIRTAEVTASRSRTRVDDLRNWEAGPEVQQSRHSLTLAEMSVNEQKKTLEELERLFGQDIVSGQEVVAARAALQRAEISAQSSKSSYEQALRRASKQTIAEAEAELQNAEDDVKRLKGEAGRQQVIAPVGGLVVAPPPSGRSEAAVPVPSAGDVVTAGSPLFAIGDVSSFAVLLNVDELEVKKIQSGQPATVTVDAVPGNALSAEVESVAGQATTDSGAPVFEVRVAITSVPDAVRSNILLGMTATVEIATAHRENVVVVPIEAIGGAPGNQYVWVLEGGARTRRQVTTGLTDQSHVEIASGLKKGEVVVY